MRRKNGSLMNNSLSCEHFALILGIEKDYAQFVYKIGTKCADQIPKKDLFVCFHKYAWCLDNQFKKNMNINSNQGKYV